MVDFQISLICGNARNFAVPASWATMAGLYQKKHKLYVQTWYQNVTKKDKFSFETLLFPAKTFLFYYFWANGD